MWCRSRFFGKPSAALFAWAFGIIWISARAQDPVTADTLQLNEVEVFGQTDRVFPAIRLSASRVESGTGRDVGDLLRDVSNVAGIRKGGVGIDPVVRGFRYYQVPVILNGGIRIEGGCPNRMDPVTSHVESEDIRRIDVLKGPFVLKYGPVLGAIVNLETDRPEPFPEPAINGEILYGFETNWNGQQEHLGLRGGNSRIFFNAAGGFKGYGSYQAGNGIRYPSSFQKTYATGSVGWIPASGHQVTLRYAFDQGRDVLYPALPMDEKIDKTHVVSAVYEGRFRDRTVRSVDLLLSFSPVHHVMDNLRRPSAKTMQAVTTVDARNLSGRISGVLRWGVHRLEIGADAEHVFKTGDKKMTMKMVMEGDTFVSVRHANVWLDATTLNTGIFAEYRIPVRSFEWIIAMRLDLNQASTGDTFRLIREGISYFEGAGTEFLRFSYSMGVQKKIFQWLTLNAALGKGTRSPSVLERYIKLMPVGYDTYDYLGNPWLRPESNYQADAGFTLSFAGAGQITTGGFLSLVTDYILGEALPPSVIKPSTQGAPGVKQFTNQKKVWLTGFECSYRSPPGNRWHVEADLAFTRGTIPQTSVYEVSGGVVTGKVTVKNDPIPEIPPLEGKVRFRYEAFRSRLIPSVEMRFVNRQGRVSRSYGEQPTPGFCTVSFSVNYQPWRFFQVSAGVDNLFDTPYFEHLNRRMTGTTDKLYEPGRMFSVKTIFRW